MKINLVGWRDRCESAFVIEFYDWGTICFTIGIEK